MTSDWYDFLCDCAAFDFWYLDDADEDGPFIRVCRCDHPESEHLNGTGPCIGEVIIH
jgi:hypothetical protein